MELLVNSSKLKAKSLKLKLNKLASLIYHDIFDYPLTLGEFIKWESGTPLRQGFAGQASIKSKNGYYFLNGREGLVYKRLIRQRISKRKLLIAKSAAKILRFIPTIKMVGVTGALAMRNAAEESDIDLMIITQKGTLWSTRLLSYLVTWLLGIKTRKPNDRNQKDKLCLNMWIDEDDLIWDRKDRNIYTAHEICQIVPLVNKNKMYERLVWKNKWVLEFWPNAIKVQSTEYKVQRSNFLRTMYYVLCTALEPVAFWFQYQYMKSKVTREIVTKTRAIFHPNDWGKVVVNRLQARAS